MVSEGLGWRRRDLKDLGMVKGQVGNGLSRSADVWNPGWLRRGIVGPHFLWILAALAHGLPVEATTDSEGPCGPCLAIGEGDWEEPCRRSVPDPLTG